jgi:hypothetical protein
MPCRLCHQKIPFWRSWFTVAEFCCDEHEKEYKELAVERLASAVEPLAAPAEKPPLPVPEPLPDELAEPEPEGAAEERVPKPAPDHDAEDLWQLADEVGASDAVPESGVAADAEDSPAEVEQPPPFRSQGKGRGRKGDSAVRQ